MARAQQGQGPLGQALLAQPVGGRQLGQTPAALPLLGPPRHTPGGWGGRTLLGIPVSTTFCSAHLPRGMTVLNLVHSCPACTLGMPPPCLILPPGLAGHPVQWNLSQEHPRGFH